MKNLSIFIACIIGTAFEWYDFAIFDMLSPILGPIFFPHHTKTNALLITFANFATGFIARPLGGIFFGHIGDKYGRKKAIVISIFLMTLTTVSIGLLPTHIKVPHLLLCFLITLRLLQGFAVSGENSDAITLIAENITPQWMFFYQGLAISGSMLGFLLGALVSNTIFSFFHTSIIATWRLPFLFSIILGGFGLYLRLKLNESTAYQKIVQQQQKASLPVKHLFRHHYRVILFLVIYIMGPQIGFYFSLIFFPSFIHQLNIGTSHYLNIATIPMLIMAISVPIISGIVYYCNAVFLATVSFVLYIILPAPVFVLVKMYPQQFALWGQTLLLIPLIISMPLGYPLATLFFPTNIRYSGLAATTNIVVCLFGGTTPLIALGLTKITGAYYAPAIYLSLMSLGSYMVLCYRKQLISDALPTCFK